MCGISQHFFFVAAFACSHTWYFSTADVNIFFVSINKNYAHITRQEKYPVTTFWVIGLHGRLLFLLLGHGDFWTHAFRKVV